MSTRCALNPPHELKVDSLENPIGLGEILPVLSWKQTASRPDGSVTAWQILVAGSKDDLRRDAGNFWDSEKVTAPNVCRATYAGHPPASRQCCWWKVRAWDETHQPSAWSEPARWEMGLLDAADWKADWISSAQSGGPRTSPPAPYFRKPFSLGQKIVSARLYATALGVYECEINGTRVSDAVFAPGWTDYKKRVAYQTYDVAALLCEGSNVLGAILGDGWYSGYMGWFGRQRYGHKPAFLAQLEVTFADGSQTLITTDASWKTHTGPILESDLLMGESYDARLELTGWSSPPYDESSWQTVQVMAPPALAISAPVCRPVRRMEMLPVKKIVSTAAGKSLYDFGQNFAGRVRVTLKGSPGVHVTMRHGEILTPKGQLYTENLRSALATDQYTLRGGDSETYEPRFTFHGFRYMELAWADGDLAVEDIQAVVLQSELPPTGHFACSNPLLNQLQHNIQWGLKSNFLEVPTDCPQRDERMGWTGDAQVFVRTAAFNADVQSFFHKWMRDARDAQRENGSVPCVIPELKFIDADGGPAWSDATIICPWTIYLCYDDVRILEEHYVSMQRYLNYLVGSSKDHIRCHPDVDSWGGFGDWLALDGTSKNSEGATPKDLIGTAFLAHDAALMTRIAAVLGKSADEAKYRALHKTVAAAFCHRFVTPEGLMAGATQTAYVLALHFDLLPEAIRPKAARALVRHLEKNDFHIATGFVGTPYICQTLENHGHLDVAYKLLEQETFPSWLFPVKNGATTIWERWDGWTPEKGFQDVGMNSFNHYAYGAIGAWMVSSVAGLELDPDAPGYRHIIFRPRPGGSLTWAEAALETPYGKTAIKWELQGDALTVALTVPVNARASFSPPAGFVAATTGFASGTHTFTLQRAA